MCNAGVCLPSCDAINFEINVMFLIKPFLYMTNMLRSKLKYLEKEKSFCGETKTFFIIFKALAFLKNCLRSQSA